MKVEIPITPVSDILFDSKIQKGQAPEPDENPDMEKINQEEREKYRSEHPKLSDFLRGS